MRLANPFLPSLVSAANPARVRTTVIVTLAGQAVLLAALLIQGCKPSAQTPPAELTSIIGATNTNTNAAVADATSTNVTGESTNVNLALATNANADLAASNATAALILPPLDTNSAPTSAPVKSGTYVVVAGDSFYKIAKASHCTIRALRAANPDVNPHKLKLGQTLNLPDGVNADLASSTATVTGTSVTPVPTTESMAAEPSGASLPVPMAPSNLSATVSTTIAPTPAPAPAPSGVYVVKSGDTLFRIARKQHTTVKELRAINNLTTDRIVLGQKLKLSAGDQG